MRIEDWQEIEALGIDIDLNNVGIILIYSPDLVDDDFNPSGCSIGHWQDDEGWKAAKWCSCHDEYHLVTVIPTHYQILEPPICVS